MPEKSNRRHVLSIIGGAGITGLTGCTGLISGGSSTNDGQTPGRTTAREYDRGETTNSETRSDRSSERTISLQENDTVLDDFDDGDTSGWDINGGAPNDIEVASDAREGEYALHITRAGTSVEISRELASPTSLSRFSFWFKYNSENDNNLQFAFRTGNDNRAAWVRCYADGIYYHDPSESYQPQSVTGFEHESWTAIEFHNIDYTRNQYDIRVFGSDNELIGETRGAPFWDEGNSIAAFQIFNRLAVENRSDPVWIDDITYTE